VSAFYKEIQKDCRGEKHTIVIRGDEAGWFYELKNHTDQEVQDEVALAALGGQPCTCMEDYIIVCELCDQLITASKEKPELYQHLVDGLLRERTSWDDAKLNGLKGQYC
jgi:hypothetical protein